MQCLLFSFLFLYRKSFVRSLKTPPLSCIKSPKSPMGGYAKYYELWANNQLTFSQEIGRIMLIQYVPLGTIVFWRIKVFFRRKLL